MGTDVLQHSRERNLILKTLWEDPIALVSGRDVPERLGIGDEYVDLQRLEAGILRARNVMVPTGGELARKAVQSSTWAKIIEQLHAA